jgi:cytochrome c oxidase subunit I+III
VLFSIGAFIAWLWPDDRRLAMLRASPVAIEAGLPILTNGARAAPWWGMVFFIATLATALTSLIYSYFFIRLFSPEWPQNGLPLPDLLAPSAIYAALLASAASQYWASRSFRLGNNPWRTEMALAASLFFGLNFVAFNLIHLNSLPFSLQTNAYGSVFHLTGVCLTVVVLAGAALVAAALRRVQREHRDRDGFMALQMQTASMFWYFVVVSGVVIFSVLYLSPYFL